jgi:hypothetical protein
MSEGERERQRAEREEREAEERAQRAAQAARAQLDDPEFMFRPQIFGSVQELNEICVYVKSIDGVIDRTDEDEMCILSKDGFCTTFASSRVMVNDRPTALPKIWLADRDRQTVDRVTFSPADPYPYYRRGNARYYNRCKPSPFESKPYLENCEELAKPIFDHLMFLCNNDARHYKVLTQFLAFAVQRPGIRINWMVLFVTPQDGVGRGFVFKLLKKVFPKQVVCKGTMSDVFEAQFNNWLASARFLCFEEVTERDSKRTRSKINSLITDDDIKINDKNVKDFNIPNVSVKIGASNDLAALPLTPTDRRVYVIKNPSHFHHDGAAYYDALYSLLEREDVVASFYQVLKQVDLTGFDGAGRAPESDATKAMSAEATPAYLEHAREINEKWPTRVMRARTFKMYMEAGGLYSKASSDEEKFTAWKLKNSAAAINAQHMRLSIRFKNVSGAIEWDDVIVLNGGDDWIIEKDRTKLRNEALRGEELWRQHLAKESAEDEQF